ncbi:MAG: hypothetical protein ACREA2_07245 [Blastocatellia bacterium]
MKFRINSFKLLLLSTCLLAAISMVLFPAAPFILMKEGKDVTIPKGTLATAFVDSDHPLDREAFVRPNERRP